MRVRAAGAGVDGGGVVERKLTKAIGEPAGCVGVAVS